MEPKNAGQAEPQTRRGVKQVLLSYFYWNYQRGSFHYDIMVTAILLFIFVTPHLWNYGDRPTTLAATMHPIEFAGNGSLGFIVTVQAADVNVPPGASEHEVREILRQAIEPVTGDAVTVEHWKTVLDDRGRLAWKVWAHR
jgi:hypothetical protein